MGKGGGCVPSKKSARLLTASPKHQHHTTTTTSSSPPPPIPFSGDLKRQISTTSQPPPVARALKIFVIFYSSYGHTETMARTIKSGIDSVNGVSGFLFRVPETLTEEELTSMMVPDKGEEIPVIKSNEELEEADGFVFGFPTRFGSMAAQMKAFFDGLGGRIWREQRLAGKPAGFFISTGTQGGGQESTAWTAITQLAHQGMIFVPIGYTFGEKMFDMNEIRGGSPYGAGVIAGDGSRPPSETELALAEHQGKYMATIVKRMAGI
ncbi:hypothetical protein LUZ60_006651 [Juncus effusus]|nr:hypothetical protein LUZ60_006651 [Juncus effusus]